MIYKTYLLIITIVKKKKKKKKPVDISLLTTTGSPYWSNEAINTLSMTFKINSGSWQSWTTICKNIWQINLLQNLAERKSNFSGLFHENKSQKINTKKLLESEFICESESKRETDEKKCYHKKEMGKTCNLSRWSMPLILPENILSLFLLSFLFHKHNFFFFCSPPPPPPHHCNYFQ